MANLKALVEAVKDQDSLVALLRDGLGWKVDPEFAFDPVPQIAEGVDADGKVRVHRLVPEKENEERLVLLAEFERPYVRRDLRELLASLRRLARRDQVFPDKTGYEDTIFIVAAAGYGDVRFVLFEEQEGRQPKIKFLVGNRGELAAL